MSETTHTLLNERYELRERLGAGGMARVFKAWDKTLERPVAIKILHEHLVEDPTFKLRFEREAKIVANLNHPNIVQVYDFAVIERDDLPLYYMVMSYIPGKTLREYLETFNAKSERIPQARIYDITLNIAEALAYAHAQGMVHRDVKPGNILLRDNGEAVLTDFGIARMIESSRLTQDGISTGTPLYMSPEQASGQSGDARSDLYSLGIILFELITGKPPFEDNGTASVMIKHLNQQPPSVSNLLGIDAPTLDGLIFKILAKNPTERYQTAQAFIDDFKIVFTSLNLDALSAGGKTVIVNTPMGSALSTPQTPVPSFLTPTPITPLSEASPSPKPTTVAPQSYRRITPLMGVLVIAVATMAVAVVILLRNTLSDTTTSTSIDFDSLESMTQPILSVPDGYFNARFDPDDETNQYWYQGEVGLYSRSVTDDGFYRLVNQRANTAETSVIFAEQSYNSISIEMRALLEEGSAPASAYGIVFRYQNADNYNVFAVDGVGRYSIWVRSNGVWRELRGLDENWTQDERIRSIGQSNRLTVDIIGDTLTGYVNSQQIIRVVDDTLDGGTVGIYFATDDGAASVLVDSYKVYPSVPSMTGQ